MEKIAILFRGRHVERVGWKGDRNQQRLHRNLLRVEGAFEFLIHDAFMRGVHVDDDQPLFVLCQDIDSGELREGKTQRRCCPVR